MEYKEYLKTEELKHKRNDKLKRKTRCGLCSAENIDRLYNKFTHGQNPVCLDCKKTVVERRIRSGSQRRFGFP